ncbi:hypothetical protein P4S64_15905 [Vibrio sp. M60_M31a]
MAAVRDYAQLAKDILAQVGGQENITRFFTLCDPSALGVKGNA